MFYCVSIKQIKKAVMLFTLLMFSTLLQAELSGNADGSDSAANAETGVNSAADDQPRGFIFPDWPERKQPDRQMVPPPPPGPYMSSALSDFSVRGPSFGRNPDRRESNKPESKLDSANVPMETFSPDRPWPDNAYKKHKHDSNCAPACSPVRWMPENGYQYVKPRVKRKAYPEVQNRNMNWSGSRLPPMGGAADGRYPYAPNYAPRYNGPMN